MFRHISVKTKSFIPEVFYDIKYVYFALFKKAIPALTITVQYINYYNLRITKPYHIKGKEGDGTL